MSNNYQIYFDCGFSKLRASAVNKNDLSKVFYKESKFLFDHTELDSEIQKIITYLEKNTNEYIDDVNLMIDSSKTLSIGISISKKIDESKLRQEDIQFLILDAKQQILKNYNNHNIVHIIINNYKIDNTNYDYFPSDVKCSFISLDILFVSLPNEMIEYFKKFFFNLDISINQITCSSYAKARNYKDDFILNKDLSFIDMGFNKTSIISYVNNKITSLNVLPIGGSHITKDISKILKIDLEQAEDIKLNFNKNNNFSNEKIFSLDLIHKIIFARVEEMLELCSQSVKSRLAPKDQHKLILMGEGSKIFENQLMNKIILGSNIDILNEAPKNICQSGFKLGMRLNKQEVVVVPKKQTKQGFFEKLFHLFD